MLNEIAVKFLLFISSLLGVSDIPLATSPTSNGRHTGWQIDKPWHPCGQYRCLEASSQDIVKSCIQNPRAFILFPQIIHSASEILVDGKVIEIFGSPNFDHTRSFYGTPIVSCQKITVGSAALTWKVYSYSRYFARFSEFPILKSGYPLANFFNESLNVGSAIFLIILAFFNLVVLYHKIMLEKVFLLFVSYVFTSWYFIGVTPEFFGLSLPMLSAHKLADSFLWVGFASFWILLEREGITTRLATKFYLVTTIISVSIILMGQTGDVVQFGTTLGFFPTLILTAVAIKDLLKLRFTKKGLLKLFSLGLFLLACINDILVVVGLSKMVPILPIGVAGCYLFILMSINEEISKAYMERDELRVIKNKLELSNHDLIFAKKELEASQARLLHKSRLESIGTLAAGVAHELNNPLTAAYTLQNPTLKLVEKAMNEGSEKEKASAYISQSRKAIKICLDITNRLKDFSGLNRATLEEVEVFDVIEDCIKMLAAKGRGKVSVSNLVAAPIKVQANRTSLSQVFLNLLANAYEAIAEERAEEGLIEFSSLESDAFFEIVVKDNGEGIPLEIREKIFDPFFTTKEVGVGTGLGLYIIAAELHKTGGDISVDSVVGEFTTFTVRLPKFPVKPPMLSDNEKGRGHE